MLNSTVCSHYFLLSLSNSNLEPRTLCIKQIYLEVYFQKIQSLSGKGVISYQILVSDWKNTTYTCEGVNSNSNWKTNGTVSVIATGSKLSFK